MGVAAAANILLELELKLELEVVLELSIMIYFIFSIITTRLNSRLRLLDCDHILETDLLGSECERTLCCTLTTTKLEGSKEIT